MKLTNKNRIHAVLNAFSGEKN